MADYYPLIARAVAGLDTNTGENRRALYERARSALVNQLRSVEPALDEADITRERLALEEAIRRLEAEAAKRPRADEAEPEEASQPRHGLQDFHKTVTEAEELGDASAEASRAARHAYDEPASGTTVGEPAHDDFGAAEPNDSDREAHEDFRRDVQDIPDEPPADTAPHYFEPPADEQPEPAETPEPDTHQAEAYTPPAEVAEPPAQPYPRARRSAPLSPEPADEDIAYRRPARSYGGLIKAAAAVLLIGVVGALGYWQRDTITGAYRKMTASSTTTPTSAPSTATSETPAGRPKISDRIGATNDSSAQPATAPAAAVAQKVVLYDEDSTDPQGKRYVGSAVWRTETVSPGSGLAPELAIRADVEIPERRMRMTWSLRRNTDKALPASHTIEIMFTLPADFPEGGIGNVPGLLMKQNEQARGVPLAGLSVKVTNNYFLIGLSSIQVDKERNVQLLKERDWFDIPIVYTSGKRAILAIEKGVPGTRAFDESFKAWGE
ncbi:hypothetical protein [Undibacter mobilis]|uniref:Uncharacterized protein n=1 Tax=Undibacter mobilis TaxID=2292256 RepID=A0A371B705_9BRAD|nr:hypothetical protein [Undibacter mobilis]RDV03287.1 hypothetical protein DXH78_01000 [Undibacter mobilis]